MHAAPEWKLAPGQLLMMTIRSHDQYNTTIYGLEDRYRGLKGDRRVVLVNAKDLRERGLVSGQTVDITSHFSPQGTRGPEETRTVRRFTTVAYDKRDGDDDVLLFTAGGYPVVATVASATMPIAAQLLPGDEMRFAEVSIEGALKMRAAQRAALDSIS